MDASLITIATLFVLDAFFAGWLAHAMWLDFIERKALRDAAADAFFDITVGKDEA